MYNMEISFGSYKLRLEIVLLIVFLLWVVFGHALCSCCKVSLKEGLEMIADANSKTEEEKVKEKVNVEVPTNENGSQAPANVSEAFATLTDVYGENKNDGLESVDIMAKMDFKPECCPNSYTNSMGCACMNMDTYHYLVNRGGNNVPFSEY